MPQYKQIQFIGYGSVTSAPTQVLDVPTNSPYRKDAEKRARTFCDVAEWTHGAFGGSLAGPDTLKVFVAPEFYFRFGGPSGSEETLRNSYPNGEILLPNIAEEILRPHFATEQYRDWLIVAGTMFWHKSPIDSDTTHPTYFNTALVIKGGANGSLTAEEMARNAQPCQVPVLAGLSTNQKQLMSTIDYAFGPSGQDHAEWDAALNPMFQPILGDWDWWRWHLFTVRDVMGPTGRPVVFGVEVCLEHVANSDGQDGIGVLRTFEQKFGSRCKGPAPQVDVHVVTSCGMNLDWDDGVTTRVNGIAAICDGLQPQAKDAPWPTMDCVRVDTITRDRKRRGGPIGQPVMTLQIPPNLQVGIDTDLHSPADAVAVSQPVALPA